MLLWISNCFTIRIKDVLYGASLGLLRENQFDSAAEGFQKYIDTVKIIGDAQIDHEELIKAFDALASEYFRR